MASQEVTRQETSLRNLDLSRIPEAIGAVIDVKGWAESLIIHTSYTEPNPDFISQMLAFNVMTAASIEEAFQSQNVKQLQRMLPNVPEASTGNIEITDLYVAESDFETGNPTYVIVTCTSMEDGISYKFTTGATNVQATIFALLRLGMWPIQCRIVRGQTKDKGGRYLLFVLPVN